MKIVFSSKLQEEIVIADSKAEATIIRSFDKGGGRVVYTKEEADMLVGRPLELIRMCHMAKRLFCGTILSIE